MKPLEIHERAKLVASFRQALNNKKDINTQLRKSISEGEIHYSEAKFSRPVSANAHLVSLIIRDHTYKRMIGSYSSPEVFWKQLHSLYIASIEFGVAKSMLNVQKFIHANKEAKIVSLPSCEFYGIVKIFNNDKFDMEVANKLTSQVQRAYANCQSELVGGELCRDGVVKDNEYI